MKLVIISASFIFLSAKIFSHDIVGPQKAYCSIEEVKNCLGGVSYHCFAPMYKVLCTTEIDAPNYKEATKLKSDLESKIVRFE